MSVEAFAPAKVNLTLHVTGRRADGYHLLDSLVVFPDVGDRLSFAPSEDLSLEVCGPLAEGVPTDGRNLCIRAAQLLGSTKGARITLEKHLPHGAGIGGGSANAAAALKGFLRVAGIDAIDDEVIAAGLAIGADVPVCLAGVACRMQGVGERIMPLSGFAPLKAILVNPLVAVSTPAVFKSLALEKGQSHGAAIADERDPATWRNDLSQPAMALAPVIGEVLQRLAATPGVTRAFMSGSGATCVALLADDTATPDLNPHWWAARTVLG